MKKPEISSNVRYNREELLKMLVSILTDSINIDDEVYVLPSTGKPRSGIVVDYGDFEINVMFDKDSSKTSWYDRRDVVSKGAIDAIIDLLLTSRLREKLQPFADKGDMISVDDNEYINISNVMYLHQAKFFDLM